MNKLKNLQITIDDEDKDDMFDSPKDIHIKEGPSTPVRDPTSKVQEVHEVRTIVKKENDLEIFTTDIDDSDFDKINQQNMQEVFNQFQS